MARATPSQATGVLGWLDQRLPVVDFWNKHVGQYYAPKILIFGIILVRWRC